MARRLVLSSQLVPLLFRRASSLAVEVDDMIAGYALPFDVASQARVDLELHLMRDLCAAMALRLNDAHAGIHCALDAPRGTGGLVEYLVRNAPTVRALLRAIARYTRLVNGVYELAFDEKTGRAHQEIAAEPLAFGRHGNEYSLVYLLRVARSVAGVAIVPERVFIANGREVDDGELVAFLGTRDIQYDCGYNGFILPVAALDTPVPSADPTLLELLESQAKDLIQRSEREDCVLTAARRAIAAELVSGSPTAKRIASMMQTSERTLIRRFAEENTSFRSLVDEVRVELATAYLAKPQYSVTDAALLLGYSDVRAFSRAFRRMKGMSPQEWRSKGGA